MRPLYRALITAGSVVLVAGLAVGVRSLTAFGVFTEVVPGFAGTCKAVPTAPGPEDIAIDEEWGFLIVSTLDRRAKAAGKSNPRDGLYIEQIYMPLELAVGRAPDLVRHPKQDLSLSRFEGTPADFHPHGISVRREPDNALTIMAINHRSDGTHSIDIFELVRAGFPNTVRETASIQGGLLVSPNAVAAVDAQRFYVTNDHGSVTHFGRQLDDDLVLPRANVLYFDGTALRVVANGLTFPSGIALSADGRYLYVGESYGRRLITYERNPLSGALTEVSTLAIPSNLDNLRLDANGVLWVGSHPKAFAMAAWRADPSKPAPSQIFKVTMKDGIPESATAVYTNLGDEIGGSSVGAVSGHLLFIGSPFADHILYCTMDH